MRVLLIEDNEDDAQLIREALTEPSSQITGLAWADRLETGFARLAEGPVDAVLVDLSLPDSHGLDTVDHVRARAQDAPVIVLTGLDDEAVAEAALLRGAQDYLVKGRLTGDSLRRAIRYAMGRHHVEQALRKSEERFHLACRATNDAIWDWDIQTGMVWWNEAYETVFGYRLQGREEPLTAWTERLHPVDRTAVVSELMDRVRSDLQLWTREYRFRRADGTYADVIDRGYVIRDPGALPRRMIGAMSDITGPRQLETSQAAQLAVSMALDESLSLDEALPNILRGIGEAKRWTVGAFWSALPQNPALRCTMLWHQPDWPADAFVQAYRTLSLRPDRGLAGRALTGGEAVLLSDLRLERDSPLATIPGSHDLRGGMAVPIRKGKAIIGILEFMTREVLRPDATQLHTLTDLGSKISQFIQDKDLERHMRQGQKMEALGRMAGGIAHDFNNLLTVINSWSELLLSESPPSSRIHGGLTQISEAGNKAAGLTRQLLAFSRHQVTKPQLLNLNDRVTDILDLLQRVIGEDIELSVSLNSTLGPIHADPGQIEQVVMNLVVNARDAMPHGGRLELETREFQVAPPDALWPDTLRPGPYVTLTVRDTGCGMDPDTLGHIFEPFFTTKERGKGTGLGLSTAYGIVRQAGGTIGVETASGQGTTFTIYLPRAHGAIDGRVAPLPHLSPAAGAGTILLVEDDDLVRGLAQAVLHARQYTVIPARNAQEALAIAESNPGRISLLLTDMVMPGMSGAELVSQLRRLLPNIKVVVTSGYSDRGTEIQESFGSTVGFLEKPYTPDSLADKVREVLGAPAQASTP
ncbi:response regulator [Nitrospirales bacterium NOB]|nr:MAG: putative hybrid sensor histidine kinase [Nitrospira sp. OLB3]MBV6470292.1 Sensor histidine kinase RcsC [Nitrospirota bacterium]MCE7964322.1 response regulator [Nitrospira sp. NTP2]MCK6493318.1 response regulator [Nitrospira sp.]MDL1888140.1 response regulator [Nitrospirales bacterium NOB]MEB2337328.1 response regulator [Nitrospirales bacterium]